MAGLPRSVTEVRLDLPLEGNDRPFIPAFPHHLFRCDIRFHGIILDQRWSPFAFKPLLYDEDMWQPYHPPQIRPAVDEDLRCGLRHRLHDRWTVEYRAHAFV